MTRIWTTLAALATLVALASPAQAIYLATPLMISTEGSKTNVGETITFDVAAVNDSAAADWAGKTVIVRYVYDKSESADPNGPTTSEEDSAVKGLVKDSLALDQKASATFTWTVPAEMDKHNVHITVEAADGELLAQTDIAVGDAPERYYLMAGSGAAENQPVQQDMGSEPPATDAESRDEPPSEVPAPGLLAALALAGVAALAARRRA